MDLVPDIVITVAANERIVDVADYGRMGDSREERPSLADLRVQGRIDIHIMFEHRQVPVPEMEADRGPVIARIGLQDAAGRPFVFVLRFRGEFPVGTHPVVAVREQSGIQAQVRVIRIERQAAPLERLRSAEVPVHERSADAQFVARRHVGGFHRQDGRKRLAVFAAVSAHGEAHAFEQEGRETPALRLSFDVRAVRDQDVHAVDEGLAFLAVAAPDIQFPVLPHFLGAWQYLQGRHHVTAGIAGHDHVQRIQGLELGTLAHAVRAGRHHNLVDGRRLLAHAYVQVGKTGRIGGQGIVFISQESRAKCQFPDPSGHEREPA